MADDPNEVFRDDLLFERKVEFDFFNGPPLFVQEDDRVGLGYSSHRGINVDGVRLVMGLSIRLRLPSVTVAVTRL